LSFSGVTADGCSTLHHTGKKTGKPRASHPFSTFPKLQIDSFSLLSLIQQLASFSPDNGGYSQLNFFRKFEKR